MRGKRWTWAVVATVALCTLALARSAEAKGSKYVKVAELVADGSPKEVALNRDAAYCMIEVVTGKVIINTVVVRQSDKKTSYKVAGKFKAGAKHVIDIGPLRRLTGLRISDGGGGKYRIHLKP